MPEMKNPVARLFEAIGERHRRLLADLGEPESDDLLSFDTVCDVLAREYGWTPDQVCELTPAQAAMYLQRIVERRNIASKRSDGQGGENRGSMTQRIEVKDSPGTTVNQIIGSSNRASQNQAKEGFLQQVGRQIVRWVSGLFSSPNKPRES